MPEEDQAPSCGQRTELRSGMTSPDAHPHAPEREDEKRGDQIPLAAPTHGGPGRSSMGDAPQDVSRVVLNKPQAMRYWTTRFDLSVEELTEAVDAVGDDVAAVAAYLNHPA
ncbi:DUF3606 domain-containing protein [Sphingobium sp. YR657]|uniref:DUF3606 domain-containing protein n=2 Tax=Sphingomonadaceae TaxID=41297 RepID=UPI003137C62E